MPPSPLQPPAPQNPQQPPQHPAAQQSPYQGPEQGPRQGSPQHSHPSPYQGPAQQSPYQGPAQQAPQGQEPPRKSRRGLVIAVVAVVVLALLLVAAAVSVVAFSMLGGDDEPTAASSTTATEAAKPIPPTPMTEVKQPDYSFSYPAHWEEQDPGQDVTSFGYYLTTLDAPNNSLLLVMDYTATKSVEEMCADLANEGGFGAQPDVTVDGVTANHYQLIAPNDEGEPQVQDLWCMARPGTIIVVAGRTNGPEAEAAGISEAQRVIDTWKWAS